MKIINCASDVYFNIKILNNMDNKIGAEIFSSFIIKFFTDDPDICLVYTIDDFIDDGILRISSQDLDFLNDGQLQMIVQFAFKDDNYEDGYFDKTATKATGYYIKHNIL